jgi:hypothetical protein
LQANHHGLGSVPRLQLEPNSFGMRFNRFLADLQGRCDFGIAEAVGPGLKNLALTNSEELRELR